MDVLLYRARLPEAAGEVVAVSVRPCPAPVLLGEMPRQLLRLVVRYTDAGGTVGVHRGRMVACSDEAPRIESGWHVTGWQAGGGELLISLAPVLRITSREPASRTDRFSLPFALEAWGVTRVIGAEINLQAVCRGGERSIFVRGRLLLTLLTPASRLRLRIPFGRLLATEDAAGLRWRAAGGVTGLRMLVAPGGRISGEASITLWCGGRPPEPLPRSAPAVPALVRELTGRVTRVEAEILEVGTALVRGAAALDLYWVDLSGHSRWTGRTAPFSGIVPVPGLAAGDQLKVDAMLERLWPVQRGSQVTGHLLIRLSVTALRDVTGSMGGREFRLEEITGRGEATVAVAEPLCDEPTPPTAGWPEIRAELALPAGAWPGADLDSAPEARLEVGRLGVEPAPGGMRWQVPVLLGGRPAGLVRGVAHRAGAGLGDGLAGLERVSEESVSMRLRFLAGDGRVPAPAPAAREWVGAIDLPGPVGRILNLAILRREPWRVRALVARTAGGLWQGDAEVAWEGGNPPESETEVDRLTAMPVQAGDRWRLRLVFGAGTAGNGG